MKALKFYLTAVLFFSMFLMGSVSDPPVYQPASGIDKSERRRVGGLKACSHRGLTRELGKSLSSKLSNSLYAKILKEDTQQFTKKKQKYPVPDYISPLMECVF